MDISCIRRVSLQASYLRFIMVIMMMMMMASPPIAVAQQPFKIPIVINTWAGPFQGANTVAWQWLSEKNATSIDALEAGINWCELNQCDHTVGFGGDPDEFGETTLDAMIMHGPTMEVGSVGNLKRVKRAISVARAVMERTYHTLLVGDDATEFAKQVGFQEESLTTEYSHQMWLDWKKNGMQPNYWKKDKNSTTTTATATATTRTNAHDDDDSKQPEMVGHDTIGMIAIDAAGDVTCGTSTNGIAFKIAGRVGDSPIVGSGAYCDNEIGGASGTGDGDIIMRFAPSLVAVENMRHGMTPQEACEDALARIQKYYPQANAGLITVSKEKGEYGGCAIGPTFSKTFAYTVMTASMSEPQVIRPRGA